MKNPYQAPQHTKDPPTVDEPHRSTLWWPGLFAVAAIMATNLAYRWPIYDGNGSVDMVAALMPWIPVFIVLVVFALWRTRR